MYLHLNGCKSCKWGVYIVFWVPEFKNQSWQAVSSILRPLICIKQKGRPMLTIFRKLNVFAFKCFITINEVYIMYFEPLNSKIKKLASCIFNSSPPPPIFMKQNDRPFFDHFSEVECIYISMDVKDANGVIHMYCEARN